MTEHQPTAEQEEARRLFATGKSLAIEAGAGAGKTSTLILLAHDALKQRRRGQYIAFNKAIVEEAGAKMPSNVIAKTAHSLAWKNVIGRNPALADRLRNSRRMKSTDIAARLGIDPIQVQIQDGTGKRLGAAFLAGIAMRGLTRFCQSADLQPEAKHVPYIDGIDLPPGANANNRMVAKALVGAMRKAWADITDDHGSLPFKHDHYLKMWHLSGPKINADFILFDEAQDANPVLVDIVRQQEHAQLVWVGDSQQQIYSFTGALNALQAVGAEQTTYLTQSFRFGPAIAAVANTLLELLKADLRLTGTETIDSVVGTFDDPDVILCRTNATAVTSLLNAIQDGKRPHLVGGGREVIDFAKGAQKLMREGWTEHPELACFSSWGEVQLYVDQDEQGGELRLLVKLIDEFGVDRILQALENMPPEAHADLVISTAHKSKGREWAHVQLADDFPAEPEGEELRLLYVAVTRAKRYLDIGASKLLGGDAQPALEPAAIVSRHSLPVAFAGVEPEEIRQAKLDLLAAAPAGEVDALVADLAATNGHTYEVVGRTGRTGRLTTLGGYGDRDAAIAAAQALHQGGAFSALQAIDTATGELIADYTEETR